MKKKSCPQCGKIIQFRSQLCNSCHNRKKALKLWQNQEYRTKQLNSLNKHRTKGKGIRKNKSCKHHIDLDRNNNETSNILILTNSTHGKLHRLTYNYLLEKGLIKKYYKWFFKRMEILNNG